MQTLSGSIPEQSFIVFFISCSKSTEDGKCWWRLENFTDDKTIRASSQWRVLIDEQRRDVVYVALFSFIIWYLFKSSDFFSFSHLIFLLIFDFFLCLLISFFSSDLSPKLWFESGAGSWYRSCLLKYSSPLNQASLPFVIFVTAETLSGFKNIQWVKEAIFILFLLLKLSQSQTLIGLQRVSQGFRN